MIEKLAQFATSTLAPALVVLVAGMFAIRIVNKIVVTALNKSKLDKSLHAIILSTLKVLLIFLTILIVAPSLGIETSSLLAVLSIAGVAVSLSIQGILGNFFSGVTLLMSKPFKVGDYIEAAGEGGTVAEITVVYTVLLTPDNKQITIPNGSITNAVIKNYSAKETRRVDWLFTADYSCDSDKVKAIIEKVVTSHEKALKDPEAFVVVSKCADSAVEYTARVWVNSADYWTVYFDVLDGVKKAFEENDIKIPYPQMDVHVKQ